MPIYHGIKPSQTYKQANGYLVILFIVTHRALSLPLVHILRIGWHRHHIHAHTYILVFVCMLMAKPDDEFNMSHVHQMDFCIN